MSKQAASAIALEYSIVDTLLAIVREASDVATAAHRWAVVLDEASPFDATYAIALVALSHDPPVRRAVAEMLVWDFPLVGADLVLEHLARDENAAVRFAVARAAHARRMTLGDGLLHRLGTDDDPRVASAAAFALATRP